MKLLRSSLVPFICAVTVLSTNSCSFNDIISVEVPDRVAQETLDDPAQAALLSASVQATFECAFGSTLLANGLLSDELMTISSDAANFFSNDRRDPSPAGGATGGYGIAECNAGGVYVPLSSARWFADNVIAKLEAWSDAQVPNRQLLIARTAALSGYSLVLLGESMCSAALDNGPELTSQQVFQEAEARFGKSITAATAAANAEMLNLARLGRARARLDRGNGSGAASDAATIPPGFVFLATRATGNVYRENPLYVTVTRTRGRGVGVEPTFRAVTWQGVPDPRVPVVDGGLNPENKAYFDQRKYNNEATGIPVARWAEAQLIIAEVQGGQAAIDIINALHTAAGIPAFTASASDAAAISAQVLEERRRELFLEGHRLYDRRRFQLGLDPVPGSPYVLGGAYGTSMCYPLPDIERDNNPNI